MVDQDIVKLYFELSLWNFQKELQIHIISTHCISCIFICVVVLLTYSASNQLFNVLRVA